MKSSRLPGFYNLDIEERRKIISKFAELSEEELKLFEESLTAELADKMIENAIGVFPLPLGIAVNFLINGKDYLVPFAIEEPSVVAAASHAAKIFRKGGGIKAEADEPIMIGQIHLADLRDLEAAKAKILKYKQKLLEIANAQDPVLISFGGGAKDIELRRIKHGEGEEFLAVHLLVDCRDAMGANAVNSMVESIAPLLEEITGGTAVLKILSNLAVYRKARAETRIPGKLLGEETARKIVLASKVAEADPFRAATHNKGIMNGIDAVCIATGNDWRAVEAGAHAYASLNSSYKPLANGGWTKAEISSEGSKCR